MNKQTDPILSGNPKQAQYPQVQSLYEAQSQKYGIIVQSIWIHPGHIDCKSPMLG